MPDQRYDDYRKHGDYIERFVFPGSVCPSLSALSDAMRRNSTFTVESLDNIGPHYARTLEHWRERFLESWGRIRKLGFDERFKRLWIYYLAYCEAGFRKRMINDLHLVLTRSNNAALPSFPRNLE
jgi:cyclopropane-fatty-acyl-phospholipid synthase